MILFFFADLLSKLPENEIVLNSSAANFISQGRFEEANYLLKRAIAKDPNYFQAYFNLGISSLKLNELDNAINAFDQSKEYNPIILRHIIIKEFVYKRKEITINQLKSLAKHLQLIITTMNAFCSAQLAMVSLTSLN